MEGRRQQIDAFFSSLESRCKTDGISSENFKIELYDKEKSFFWLFHDSKIKYFTKKTSEFRKIDTKFSLKIENKVIDDIIDKKTKPATAFLTRRIKYSGNWKILNNIRPQLISASRESIEYLRKTNKIDSKMLNLIEERFNSGNSETDSTDNESENSSLTYESERFLASFFKAQKQPIKAASYTSVTDSLINLSRTLINNISSLKKEVKSLKRSSSLQIFKRILKTVFFKTWLIYPLILSWRYATNQNSGFRHVAVLFLLSNLNNLPLLLLSSLSCDFSNLSVYFSDYFAKNYGFTAFGVGLGLLKVVLSRQIYIYISALFIIFSYFFVMVFFSYILKWNDNKVESIYSRMHLFFAPFACDRVLRLRSVFVKFGQCKLIFNSDQLF